MKQYLQIAGFLVAAAGLAQAQSPAVTETTTIGGKKLTIALASAKVNGSAGKLFGKDGRIGEDPNYPIWRAGANAATKLETEGDLQIGNLAVPAGNYTLYVDLTDPEKWVLVVSKLTGQWGLKYDKSKDLGRVPMKMSKPAPMAESLKYTLTDDGGGKGKLALEWENHAGTVPLTMK